MSSLRRAGCRFVFAPLRPNAARRAGHAFLADDAASPPDDAWLKYITSILLFHSTRRAALHRAAFTSVSCRAEMIRAIATGARHAERGVDHGRRSRKRWPMRDTNTATRHAGTSSRRYQMSDKRHFLADKMPR